MQFDPTETIKIRRSVKYLFLSLVISALISAIGILGCYLGYLSGELLTKGGLSCVFLVVFFGSIAYFSLTRMWHADKPVIFIGPDGFFDKRVFKQVIPWHAIEEMRVDEFGFFGMLWIEVKERKYILPRHLSWLKPWIRVGSKSKCYYPLDGLAIERDKLGLILERYARRQVPIKKPRSALPLLGGDFHSDL